MKTLLERECAMLERSTLFATEVKALQLRGKYAVDEAAHE